MGNHSGLLFFDDPVIVEFLGEQCHLQDYPVKLTISSNQFDHRLSHFDHIYQCAANPFCDSRLQALQSWRSQRPKQRTCQELYGFLVFRDTEFAVA
jgi:hypothetical protein